MQAVQAGPAGILLTRYRFSAGAGDPGSAVAGQPEHGEAGRVDRSGEQGEVGGDLDLAADPGRPPAVSAAHQVADLALDPRPRRPVAGLPAWAGLARAGPGQLLFIGPA